MENSPKSEPEPPIPTYDVLENPVFFKVEPKEAVVSTIIPNSFVPDEISVVKEGKNASLSQKSLEQSLMTRYFVKPNLIAHVVASNPEGGETSLTALNPVSVDVASNSDGAMSCLNTALNPPSSGFGESTTSYDNTGLADGPIGDQNSVVKLEMDEYEWIQIQ